MAADVSREEEKDFLGNFGDKKDVWDGKLPPLLQDLNLPPPTTPAISYSSVCTLEKVKSALERANCGSTRSSPDPNLNESPRSMKRQAEDDDRKMDGQDSSGANMDSGSTMTVTVCPGCFQYLLVPKADPTCPKCDAHVSVLGWNGNTSPSPSTSTGVKKKAKIFDLNSTTN